MCRHLFLVMIEAQNKSCNLGYIQPSLLYLSTCTALTPTPVLKLGGGGMNWKVETLKVSSTCLVRLLKIYWILLKKKCKVIYDVC